MGVLTMEKSLTLHNYNKTNRGHNIRAKNCTDNMEHINKDMTKYNITLKDEKLTDAYKRLFGEALKEYNEKQQNPQRKIKNYYQHVKKSNKNIAYELVLAIGDKETTGSNYEDTEIERKCLIEYFDTFKDRNKHLECVGFYIHYDEATVHAHLSYIPVATGYKNGLKVQPGLNKALGLQGFTKKGKLTAQMQWQAEERKAFKEICISRGIDITDNVSDKHKHMEKETFIQYQTIQKNKEAINQTNNALTELKEELEQSKIILKEMQGEILKAADVKEMTLGTNILGKPNKSVKLDYKDYIDLKETAAYVEDIAELKDNMIYQEQEKNKDLKKENFKLFGQKQKAELDYYKVCKNMEQLERTLDDYIYKYEELEKELKHEKLYSNSLEMFMNNITVGGNSVLDMYVNEYQLKQNRQQRRAKKFNKNYDDLER